jgi:hypothetical protein
MRFFTIFFILVSMTSQSWALDAPTKNSNNKKAQHSKINSKTKDSKPKKNKVKSQDPLSDLLFQN